MTRADCQALSKHHHVCWLSIPCLQHKIGGQRIIGVRDGKDIWGQPVHPSAFSPPPHPRFQIMPYIIFFPPALVQFSRSSVNPCCHLWGMMLEALSSFSSANRDIACAPSWHSWTSSLVVSAERLKANWKSLLCGGAFLAELKHI